MDKEVIKHFEDLIIKYDKKVMELQQRNEKAVEYINNLRDESAERQGFYNCFPDDLYIADIEELLNILKGDDIDG